MITIVWDPQGLHLIDALLKVQKFKASYYIDMILQSLLENQSIGPGPDLIIDGTMPGLILLERLSNCAGTIAWEWHHIHRTHRT
jgi:hypothetical protein